MNKVKERLAIMNIKTGDLLGEPIAIMCYNKFTTWGGRIKLQLEMYLGPHIVSIPIL